MLQQEIMAIYYSHEKICLNELLENIDDALIATDTNYIIINWNKAAEHIYGISAQEAIGKKRTELIDYDYLGISFSQIINELKTKGKWKGILQYKRNDGVGVYLQSSASVIRNDVDDIVGYVTINRDITQHYLAGQSLQLFTAIMHSLHESFLVVDRDMKVVFLSPKQVVLEYHNSDYQIGDHALKFIPERDIEEVKANYARAFNGETIRHEAGSNNKDSTQVYLDVTYLPIKNTFGFTTHVAIIVKDITNEKRMALILQKQKRSRTATFS